MHEESINHPIRIIVHRTWEGGTKDTKVFYGHQIRNWAIAREVDGANVYRAIRLDIEVNVTDLAQFYYLTSAEEIKQRMNINEHKVFLNGERYV